MRLPYRDHHLVQFLESWRPTAPSSQWRLAGKVKASSSQEEVIAPRTPLDRSLYLYFRHNRSLGSKDREEIAQLVYQLVRWHVALDALHPDLEEPSWHERLGWLKSGELEKRFNLPPHAQVSFPPALFSLLVKSWGEEKALEIAEILQEQAPVFLRVNTIKSTRQHLLDQFPPEWGARAGSEDDCIILKARPAVFQSQWFQDGHFEMQDEGSQYLANLVLAKPGDWVLDYCSGSGGKALAIAPRLSGKGQLFLHDIRKSALIQAKTRLKRAGIQNAQILSEDHKQLERLKKKCQWVLVDAPCSGSGTLRRNPDMKEKIDENLLSEMVSSQRRIFERALSFLHHEGTIVYATCSLLREENEAQVEHFLKTYPITLEQPPCQLLPKRDGHDGFFAAVFRKKEKSQLPTLV